jgi:hypothetical protein
MILWRERATRLVIAAFATLFVIAGWPFSPAVVASQSSRLTPELPTYGYDAPFAVTTPLSSPRTAAPPASQTTKSLRRSSTYRIGPRRATKLETRVTRSLANPGGYAAVRSRSCAQGDGGPSYLVISSHFPRETVLVAAGPGRCGHVLVQRFAGDRFRSLPGSCAHQFGGRLGLYVLPGGDRIRLRGLEPLSVLHVAACSCPEAERLCLRTADRRGQPAG